MHAHRPTNEKTMTAWRANRAPLPRAMQPPARTASVASAFRPPRAAMALVRTAAH
jgi:hypothetical protein